jgi:NADH dehydrogenase
MTSQRAQRQTKQLARNVTASLGIGRAEPYKHHDLGFFVDLARRGGRCEPPQRATLGSASRRRGSWPTTSAPCGQPSRVLGEWALNVISPPGPASLGLVSSESVPLDVNRPRA